MVEDTDERIIRRELDTDEGNPAVQVANCVADLEETKTTDLPTMYDCVDGMLDNLFSEPPDPSAQMEVEFSYRTYRITVYQDGAAEFVKTE